MPRHPALPAGRKIIVWMNSVPNEPLYGEVIDTDAETLWFRWDVMPHQTFAAKFADCVVEGRPS